MTFGPSASRLFLALAATITAACSAQQPAQAPTPLPRPFGHGQASHHIMALAPYTFDNTVIHLRFDFSHKTVFGDELAVIRPKSDGLALVPFNSTDINYQSVTVNGKAAAYDLDAAHTLIDVHLPSPASTGQALKIEFHYSTKPRNGLYFVLPDKAYPGITPEIWTQGEPEFNRNWFPTSDEPNEKTPSELVVTVPKGWTVVGNGSLKAHLRTNDEETWNWDSRLPKSTYLIAFVAGPLSVNHTTLGSLDVDSYVQPPYPDVNATCFGDTNDIVDYFQQRIGVRFPWEKEDQMTAQRFIYGGMENASATIQTALALHPQSEEPESSCDQLVAHELAQQWFGDDATMKDWGDVWLHEGFASYFDELWNEHRNGEAEFEYDRYEGQQAFIAETAKYYRPIVDVDYGDPLEIFDASSHQRPAQVLHSLRWMFGDTRFFSALRTYLLTYQYRNADTHQFFASIDKSLGTDLAWFEDEWFYRPSYPEYHVDDSYDVTSHTLTLHVRQENHDAKPFRMPIAIEAWVGKKVYRVLPLIEGLTQTVVLRGVPSKPQMVLFDPNNNVLRKLTFPKSVDELGYQLQNARHVGDREWALSQLARDATLSGPAKVTAMNAVRAATLHDPFLRPPR